MLKAKQIKGDCRGDKKQELSNSEPERLLSFRGFLIRILCHFELLIRQVKRLS